jgi:hypothetical protein
MLVTTFRRRLLIAGGVLLLAPQARATTLIQMNLADLAGRADKIFRGTVLSSKPGTVQAGGGQLPIVIYRIRVDERFKGDFGQGKQAGVVEIRMVGGKENPQPANLRHFSLWRDVPRLERGRDYVLFTTRPSSIGLSTTVGLGQGAFTITGTGKGEQAVNAFGNVGLDKKLKPGISLRAGRPVAYDELAKAIRAVVSE